MTFIVDSQRTRLSCSISTTTAQRQEKNNNRKREKSIRPSTWSRVLGNTRNGLNVTNGVSGKSLQPHWKRTENLVQAEATASVNEIH